MHNCSAVLQSDVRLNLCHFHLWRYPSTSNDICSIGIRVILHCDHQPGIHILQAVISAAAVYELELLGVCSAVRVQIYIGAVVWRGCNFDEKFLFLPLSAHTHVIRFLPDLSRQNRTCRLEAGLPVKAWFLYCRYSDMVISVGYASYCKGIVRFSGQFPVLCLYWMSGCIATRLFDCCTVRCDGNREFTLELMNFQVRRILLAINFMDELLGRKMQFCIIDHFPPKHIPPLVVFRNQLYVLPDTIDETHCTMPNVFVFVPV